MAETINNKITSDSPYYDDYDSTKNHNKVLFKPGYSVQARELTQLQSIIQNQLSNVLSFLFPDNNILKGCDISLKGNGIEEEGGENVYYKMLPLSEIGYIQLQDYQSQGIEFANVDETSTSEGIIILTVTKDDDEQAWLTFKYINQDSEAGGFDLYRYNNFEGTFDSGATYSINDIVIYDTSYYINLTGIAGTNPSTDATNWETAEEAVYQYVDESGTEPITINFDFDNWIDKTYTAGGGTVVYDDDWTAFENDEGYTAIGILYNCLLCSVDDGYMFLDENLIAVYSSDIFVDMWNGSTLSNFTGYVADPPEDAVVVFDVAVHPEYIINDWTDDNTLLDNSNGSPNYNAPGANRLITQVGFYFNKFDTSGTSTIQWTDSNNYEIGDVVYNTGSYYKCIANSTNVNPGDDTGWENYWDNTFTVIGKIYYDGESESEQFSYVSELEKIIPDDSNIYENTVKLNGDSTIDGTLTVTNLIETGAV